MEKRDHPVAVFSVLAVVGLTAFLNSLVAGPGARESSQVISSLSASRYQAHVNFLASTDMKGRAAGAPELDKAADYIAQQFRLWGLLPAGENNTYFQSFDVITAAELGQKNGFRLNGTDLRINDDFVPIRFSNTAEFEGPVVFAGYGITAPEFHYDDYRGIDANNKIVVVFRHEPQELDAKSPFAGTNFTAHASFINKAINARQHGASGIVFITDPNNHENEELGSATAQIESEDMGIPSIHAKREPVMKMFQAAGKDLAAIQKKIDTDLQAQSFELPDARVRVATDVIRIQKKVRNVVAVVPGSDRMLRNEWVVVGAHYDHLGLGERDSLAPSQKGQVHHGADDNASGTSGVLELARLAAQNKGSWKRSVLFMAFAAEEIGLRGSSHFANNPTVPIRQINGMINMDMIGRINNDKLYVGGVGTAPEFSSWLQDSNKSVGLMLDYSDSGYGASDHTSFNAKKIPVLFFFSGLHTDYHKPSDTAEKINAQGSVKVLSLVYMMIDKMAGDQGRLEYVEVRPPQTPAGGGGGGYGTYFGSVPDFRDDLKGVLFADVQNNSPAAKAGLKAGDLMVEFDGKPIQNLYDFTYALRSKKPGDKVVVVVKRNSQDVKAEVTLEARR